MDELASWGWHDHWETLYREVREQGEPARVTAQERHRWLVRTAAGEAAARIPTGAAPGPVPVVGDWVVVTPGPSPSDPLSIVALLPRRSAFSRGAAGGGGDEQVLGANIDLVWILHGLDTPPNLRRLERFLAVAWQSGAAPSVVLTKADLSPDLQASVDQVRQVAPGVPVHAVSTEDPGSLQELRLHLAPGRTVVLLGPSGAGKSTLVNLLSGAEVAATGDVRTGDRKGRHTTTRRQLFPVAGGALVIDTPGLRELRLPDLAEGLGHAFPDIDELAGDCRFSDCRHQTEPGCAVLAAADRGDLPPERLESYRKLQAEAAWMERQSDVRARKAALSEHKTARKTMRFHLKRGDGD